MVEKIDPQVLSRLPLTGSIPAAGFKLMGEMVGEGSKSSPTRARKARDDREVARGSGRGDRDDDHGKERTDAVLQAADSGSHGRLQSRPFYT